MAPQDLVQIARSLDQNDTRTFPEKLSQIWDALSASSSSPFHAAEEVILRWLLKNMQGTSSGPETCRRFPLTWSVMACIFQRIPLFTLAKVLADRKFISVVSQTSKDIANPQKAPGSMDDSSDTVMADASEYIQSPNQRKRKRTYLVSFDIGSLQTTEGCIKSAESLFTALQSLLNRFVTTDESARQQSIGAEHLRSLFSTSAADTMDYLVPLLRACALTLGDHNAGPLEKQATWVATISSVWDLHLQNPDDAPQIAVSLAPVALPMLGKLRDIPKPWNVQVGAEVKDAWATALERLLMSNTVLPARALFASRQDVEILTRAAVTGGSTGNAGITSVVLFQLALKACQSSTQAGARKSNEEWIQKAFEIIEEPIRDLDLGERNQVMGSILEMATKSGQAPGLQSLRLVCTRYVLQDVDTDWHLISQIAECDADAFLVSSEGSDLLDTVLQRAASAKQESTTNFLVALAHGFARSRDLSGFIKRWHANLGHVVSEAPHATLSSQVWFDSKLRNAVAKLLQPSLTTHQLLSLVDWIESQKGSSMETVRLALFDTIARGIESEDFVDAVGTRLFDETFDATKKSKLPELHAMRWRLTKKTISWLDIADVRHVWKDIRKPLRKVLTNSKISGIETFEAFRCALVAWDTLKSVEEDGTDAGEVVSDFLARIEGEVSAWAAQEENGIPTITDRLETLLDRGDITIPAGAYLQAILHGSPSGLSSITKGGKEHDGLLGSFLSIVEKSNASQDNSQAASRTMEVSLTKLNGEHNQAVIERAVNVFVAGMQPAHNEDGFKPRRFESTIDLLLELPPHTITRESRERIMSRLLSFVGSSIAHDKTDITASDWRRLLSLMVRVMQDPTFYDDMKFTDLVTIGESLEEVLLNSSPLESLETWALFRELAKLTIKQMLTTVDKREAQYFRGLTKTTSKWNKKSSSGAMSRSTLLSSIYSAVLEMPISQDTIQEHVDIEKVKEQSASLVADALHRFKKSCKKGEGVVDNSPQALQVIVALENSQPRNSLIQQSRLTEDLTELKAASDKLCAQGQQIGWMLRTFLVEYFSQQLSQIEMTDLGHLFGSNTEPRGIDLSPHHAPVDLLIQNVNAVTKGMDGQAKLNYLQRLMKETKSDDSSFGELVAASQLLEKVSGEANGASQSGEALDLAMTQGILAEHLQHTRSSAEFTIVIQTLCKILNKSSSTTTQWNIDHLLSTVCTVSDELAKGKGGADLSPTTLGGLCTLVETIIKRHRLRLEGHLHLLITTLQSLLQSLISGSSATKRTPTSVADSESRSRTWKDNARQVSRLLELVCEPSVASVTRSQKPKLDSATDAAKRSAGQYIYLVLMLYIKLQLEQNVSHQLREALEPGIFSILTITSEQTRKVMNDAMDSSGRAIFRETYKKWQRFGKWKGV